MAIDMQQLLAVLGEPKRFRIIELLANGPRTVGEIAASLGALQPQTTKHVQALEAAGVIRVHRLGRRRVARLDRDMLGKVAGYFEGLAEVDPDDAELDAYERAIAVETATPAPHDDVRTLRFEREFSASGSDVWEAWTHPARAARWWAPRHFTVDAFEIAPRAGAPIRIVLREGDGNRYESLGRVDEAEPNRRLVFTLAPVDDGGEPLFEATHILTIEEGDKTTARLVIQVSEVRPEAASAVAGLEPGWRQLFDALDTFLRD